PWCLCIQHHAGGVFVESPEPQLLQPRFTQWILVSVTNCDQHRGWLSLEPTRDKRESSTGWLIKPLRVLENQQQAGVLGRVADQLERRERDQVEVGSVLIGHAERREQGASLASGQPLRDVKYRAQELMEAAERKAGLRLNSHRRQQPDTVLARLLCDRRQQGGLPNPGRASHDQGTAHAVAE